MSCKQCGECSNNCSDNQGEVQPVQMPETVKVKMRSDFYQFDHLEEV